MSLENGAAGVVGPRVDPCAAHDSSFHPEQTQVLPVQRINVTFPDLPASVKPPFNVTHTYNIPNLQICSMGNQSGSPTWINQTWFEWDAHPFNWTTRGRLDPDQLGNVGDAYTFSIWQVQPDNGGQYPYWLSDNHTIVEKLDGAGHLARGNITEAQFVPTLILALMLLLGVFL